MKKRLKVLVIRFSSIGDIVLTTPVLRCLKTLNGKEVEVHFVTKKRFASILHDNPHIDQLHLLDGKLSPLIARLRKERYDFLIDLHHNTRSAIIKLALRRPSGSFYKMNIEKWLLTCFKVNRMSPVHVVDRYFAATASLGVENDGKGLDFFLPAGMTRLPEVLPHNLHNAFIAFAIGGRHATKRLPNDKIISIIKKLPLSVVLLGGKDDSNNGKIIAATCGQQVFNACGLLTLKESAFLVKQAELVIAHDTGLMHIAAAFNKHIVSVWGNTVPDFGMYPYMPEHADRLYIAEVKDLPCRPCSKIGYRKCPKGHFDCMMKIDEGKIIDAVNHMFTRKKVGQSKQS